MSHGSGVVAENISEFSVAQCLFEKNERLLEHIEDLQKQLDVERRWREGKYANFSTDAISNERFDLIQIVTSLQQRVQYEFQVLDNVMCFVQQKFTTLVSSLPGGVSPVVAADGRSLTHTGTTSNRNTYTTETTDREENVARQNVLLQEALEMKSHVLQFLNENTCLLERNVQSRAPKILTLQTTTAGSKCLNQHKQLRRTIQGLRQSLRGVSRDVQQMHTALSLTFHKCVDTILENDRQKDTIVRYHQHVVDIANQNISLLLELKSSKHHTTHQSSPHGPTGSKSGYGDSLYSGGP
eukprot:PhF_6_TR19230/c1_g1_i1/m.28276